jgi:hypothetical protein
MPGDDLRPGARTVRHAAARCRPGRWQLAAHPEQGVPSSTGVVLLPRAGSLITHAYTGALNQLVQTGLVRSAGG